MSALDRDNRIIADGSIAGYPKGTVMGEGPPRDEPPYQFLRQVLGTWWDDDKSRQVDRLADHWVQETEEFDQLICRTKNERGIAIPMTREERIACTEFARELERDYIWIVERLGLPGLALSHWLAARGKAVRHYERRERAH